MSFGYATKRNTALAKIPSKPAVPWVRNPSWTALTSVTSADNKFVGLHRVDPDSTFLALSAAGNYTVDWGDGTATENINTGVVALHQYTFTDAGLANTNAPVTLTDTGDLVTRTAHGYSNGYIVSFYNIISTTGLTEAQIYYVVNVTANTFQVSATQGGTAVALTTDGTATLLPYKLAIVTVTPQAGQTFTTINLHQKHTQTNLNTYSSGFLDIVIAGSSLTSILIGSISAGSGTQSINFRLLEQVSILSSAIASASFLFYLCSKLQNVVGFSSSALTNCAGMFTTCTALTTVPLFNTAAVTAMNSMFAQCYALTSVPLFNTALVTNMNFMFYNCQSIPTVPLFNTVSAIEMYTMFGNAFSLISVPLFNTASVIDMSYMFQTAVALTSVPLFNTALVVNMSFMFNNCRSLTTVPLLNTGVVTNMAGMFSSCFSLTSVPLFNTGVVTNMAGMFTSCTSLASVPLFNTVSVATWTTMFSGCSSLTTVPLFNMTANTSASTMFNSSCPQLSKAALSGNRYAITYASCKLSETELTSIIDNLGTANTQGLILTISTNWGATTPVSLACNTTAGSTAISAASTTGVVVGMQWTGTGSPATTSIGCFFADVGDLVSKTAHGLSDGDEVSFASIVTTTGISINKIYFVINATANSFQVALTSGGTAVALTTDGFGTVRWKSVVTAITAGSPNSTITVSRPATATNVFATFAFRTLKTQTALLKGWAVTG